MKKNIVMWFLELMGWKFVFDEIITDIYRKAYHEQYQELEKHYIMIQRPCLSQILKEGQPPTTARRIIREKLQELLDKYQGD